MPTVHDPVQQVFESVIKDFKLNLKDDELFSAISKTTTIDEVYDATDKLQEEQAKKGHLRHLSKIQPYLEGLNAYASVIEVFLQAKQEVLALIWGPSKLILQMASVLKQSFDAIIDTTAEIGIVLPEFSVVAKLFDHNKQIKDILALFFKDLLQFYLIALKFFSLPRWKYFFESLWPRHRSKIKIVTDHISRLTLLMRNEVRLEHIQEEHNARRQALEHFEQTEKHHRRQEYESIKADVSPKTYEDKYYYLQGRICEGTGNWLVKDVTFTKWLDISDTSTKLLWLQGIPGAGKTFLSYTVLRKTQPLGRTVYAFLSYTQSEATAISILHSLMFQLAANDDDLQSVVGQSSREELRGNIDSATRLLTKLLACAGPAYIVIDGVDELEEVERGRLLQQLDALSGNSEDVKILFSSRPEADITRILAEKTAVIRIDQRNAGSIQAFLTWNTQRWYRERGFLPEAQSEIGGLLAPLAAKSKGMFLYAKIVLSNIEHLEIDDIRHELEVLPESLDDAYGRILSRINNLKPAKLRDKARRLLGWISCCPIPITIHEMEHALTVSIDDKEGNTRVRARLNIIQICGPIVEVVDDYVQFVHFTVKEYLICPQVNGFIDYIEATLSLAVCCITYLCQTHHDPDILDEEIRRNVLLGAYRLHDLATNMWFPLVERVSGALNSSHCQDVLVGLLEELMSERSNNNWTSDSDKLIEPKFPGLPIQSKELHELLCGTGLFLRACSNSDFNKPQGLKWINLDPLTLSGTSVRIYEQFDNLLCKSKEHDQQCRCAVIQWHYGKRLFKCGFICCPFRRLGFEVRSDRSSHMKLHGRPWKCSFADCEFAEGGFLSRKMRDHHLDRFHQEATVPRDSPIGNLDADEVQPLLFDVVKANKVDIFRTLIPQFNQLSDEVRREVCCLAASFSSSSLLDVLKITNSKTPRPRTFASDLAKSAIRGENMESFNIILSELEVLYARNKWSAPLSPILEEVIRSGSEAFYEAWETRVDFKEQRLRSKQAPPGSHYITRDIVRATEGRLDREQRVLQVWKKVDIKQSCGSIYVGDALVNVASTTQSIRLAEYLLGLGANVNHRRSPKYMTPLRHAATHDSATAAEFMKFLLLKGADPELVLEKGERAGRTIREEKGCKNIAKWLNISWDELVASCKDKMAKKDNDIEETELEVELEVEEGELDYGDAG